MQQCVLKVRSCYPGYSIAAQGNKKEYFLEKTWLYIKIDLSLSGTSTSTCKSSEFDCKAAGCTNPDNEKCKGTCIPKSWANNGEEQCADGSDEGTIGMKNNLYS